MPRAAEHTPPTRPLADGEAEELAVAMRALGAPSRIRLLWALLDRELTVEQVAAEAGLEQSAASHQLRILRDLRFVAARREGRHMVYRLADHHLPDLLAAVRHHREHAGAGQRWVAAAERRTARI